MVLTKNISRIVLCSAICVMMILFQSIVIPEGSIGYYNSSAQTEGSEEVFFTVIHTNDEHSALIPHTSSTDNIQGEENPSVGGYARLSTLVNQIRQEKAEVDESVFLFSAGDFIGGFAYSWLVPRIIPVEMDMIHRLGYDAVVIGNHEFDYGTDVLAEYLVEAGYPQAHEITAVLSTNISFDENHPLEDMGLYKNTHIIETNEGVKIGLLGIIGDDAVEVTADPDPVIFLDRFESAKNAVIQLKDSGADIIIALSHSGVDEDEELAQQVPGINVIIGGHCHTALYEPVVVNETIIVQTGEYLENAGVLELAYDPENKTLRTRNEETGQNYLVRLGSEIPKDPEILEIIDYYTEQLNYIVNYMTGGKFKDVLDTVIISDFPLEDKPEMKETNFGNFITDAMRLVTWEKTGERVDVAIQANGSIRGRLTPGSTEYSKGKISFYDISSLVGLGYGSDGYAGYPIVSFYLTGEELRRVLEVAVLLPTLMDNKYYLQISGLSYDFNPKDAVLVHVPFLDLPIPSTRAVKNARLYTGEGKQKPGSEDYIEIKHGDEKLYHVVTDSYILSFLPVAGEILPQLDIVPKDIDGNIVPSENYDSFVVRENGKELKVWHTVVEYAAGQEPGNDGIPKMPEYYSGLSGRINAVSTIPLVVWPIIVFVFIITGIVIIVRRIIGGKKAIKT